MNVQILIPLMLAFVPDAAMAGDDYKCTVERVHASDEDSADYLLSSKAFTGSDFTVDRATGLMVGPLKNSFATKPQVIDRGSKSNSFKVVTTLSLGQGAGYGSNVYTLIIDEYVDGPKKPFVFLENAIVYFGHCVHF